MEGLTLQCMWTNLGRSLEHNYLYSTIAASGPFPGSLKGHSSDHLQYYASQKLSLARVHDLHDVIFVLALGTRLATIKIVMHGMLPLSSCTKIACEQRSISRTEGAEDVIVRVTYLRICVHAHVTISTNIKQVSSAKWSLKTRLLQ